MVGEPTVVFLVARTGAVVALVIKEVFHVPKAEEILIGCGGYRGRRNIGSRRLATSDQLAEKGQEGHEEKEGSAQSTHGESFHGRKGIVLRTFAIINKRRQMSKQSWVGRKSEEVIQVCLYVFADRLITSLARVVLAIQTRLGETKCALHSRI